MVALCVIVLPVTWLARCIPRRVAVVGRGTFVRPASRVNRCFVPRSARSAPSSRLADRRQPRDSGGYTRISDLWACASICIIIALINMLMSSVANIRSVIGDALIVGLGSWLISWVALIEPAIRNRGGSLGDSILGGAYQPAGTVVLFLLVLLLFSGSGPRQASVWLVTLSMAFNLAADVLWGLAAAGHIGDGATRTSMGLYVAAYFTAAGAFINPTVVWLKRSVDEPLNTRVFGRLILTTSSLIVPIIALAATGPRDRVRAWFAPCRRSCWPAQSHCVSPRPCAQTDVRRPTFASVRKPTP